MKRRYLLPIIILAALVSGAAAQEMRSPGTGSAERKEILNVVRVPTERDLKQKVSFVVDQLNIKGQWAFASGQLQTPSGERVKLNGTAYEGEEDFFDNNFFALLKKTRGKWRVVEHALGCTDVCYLEWPARFKAPKEIFGIGDNFDD